METSRGCSFQVFRQSVASQGHQKGGLQRRVLPHGPRQIIAVHSGQADIAKHDVGAKRPKLLDSVRPAVGDLDLMLADFQDLTQTFRRVEVVFDDENPPADLRAARVQGGPLRASSGVEWQPDDKGCAFPEPVTLRLDAAPMHLDQALDQGQSQPQPSLAAIERLIGLHKRLEQTRDRVRCHANPVVDHANQSLTRLGRDRNMRAPCAGSELRCILQKVPQHLCYPGCVGIDQYRGSSKIA